jgi:signal transduction histidine kinase
LKNWKFIVAIAWTLFTSSLAVWWLVFGLRQLNRVDELSPAELIRQQKMLFWEGGILVALLLIGGGAIIYYMLQLIRSHEQLKRFFATFSHELRTSIASLRLQAETLNDDYPGNELPQLPRLIRESIRLQMQLENSLNLSQIEDASLFLQPISIKKMMSSIHHQWPGMSINVTGEDEVYADERALYAVITNLIQNSSTHGSATEVNVEIQKASEDENLILLKDNGKGFDGDWGKLSQLFVRHNHKSGSGVGLFLAKALVRKMNGQLNFLKQQSSGFAVEIRLPNRRSA